MPASANTKPGNICPICSKPTAPDVEDFPFCSDRCRKIDLGKWLNGKYIISRTIEESNLEEGSEENVE